MGRAQGFVHDLRVVLRGAGFRALFATRLASQAGDGAFQTGLAGLFFFSPERSTTAADAAVAFAVAVLPYTVVGPFAGLVLDRWRRRNVLLLANLIRTGLVVGVALLVTAGAAEPVLYAAVLACLSVNRFFLAGLGASLPHVVPPDELVMADAVSPTSGTVATLLGAAAGYGVLSLAGSGPRADAAVLVAAAGAYLASSALAARMAPDLLGPDVVPGAARSRPIQARGSDVRGVLLGIRAGARHVRERRPALHALGLIGAHRLAFGLSTVATILICRALLRPVEDPDAGFVLLALVVAVSGAGFATAAVVTPVATRRLALPTYIALSSLVAALAQAVVAVRIDVPVLLGSAFVLGLAVQGAKICVDATVQQAVDDGYRGRVFSFYDVVYNAAFIAGAALAAATLPADGYSSGALGAMAAVYLAAAVAYARVSRSAPARA